MFIVYWRAFHYIFHCVEDHLVAESDSAAGRLGRLAQLAACHPQQLAALIYAEERDPAGPSGMGGGLGILDICLDGELKISSVSQRMRIDTYNFDNMFLILFWDLIIQYHTFIYIYIRIVSYSISMYIPMSSGFYIP
jgi:hypothetical protein